MAYLKFSNWMTHYLLATQLHDYICWRRFLRNPIRCVDQAAVSAAKFLFVQAYSIGHDEAAAGPYLGTTLVV